MTDVELFLCRFDILKDQGAAVNSDSRSDNGSVQKGHIYNIYISSSQNFLCR